MKVSQKYQCWRKAGVEDFEERGRNAIRNKGIRYLALVSINLHTKQCRQKKAEAAYMDGICDAFMEDAARKYWA